MDITPRGFKSARSELTSEQLDRPIDVDVAPIEEKPAEVVVEPEVIESEAVVEPEVVEEEETKVPRSRFLTVHKRAIEAEKLLREMEAQRTQAPVPAQEPEKLELPDHWIEMFGDSEASAKAYEAEQARLSLIEERAAERAYERLENRDKEEEARTNEIVQSFDQAFEELGVVEGREFSDDEQVAMLDIVEEYSPKDKDGKLLRDFLLPLDKAYEIYSVRQEVKSSEKRAARSQIASLTGARSEGTPSASSAADWKPGWQGQWRNKVP